MVFGHFAVLLYRILLDVSYYYVISPWYAYRGLDLDVNPMKLVESYVVLPFILLCLPKKSERISSVVLQLLILVGYIPLTSYYALSNEAREWFYLATFFWFTVVFLNRTKLTISFRPLKEGKYVNLIISGLFSVVSLILIYRYIGFSFNLDLSKVYDIRAAYKEAGIPLYGYLINWTAKIILPFIILVSLFSIRSYFLFLFAIISEIILFSSSGHKTYLFSIPAVIGIALFVDKKNILPRLSIVFSSLILLGMLSFWLIKDIWISSILTRRLFFIPAQLSFLYYEFFTDNPLYLSHSILGAFIDYPFDLDPSHLIGRVYFNNPKMGANNGIVADGYMNFGCLGLVLWAILLAIMFKFADTVAKSRDVKVVWPLLILSFLTLVNGALLTTLLTHGLVLALLIAYLTKKQKMAK